MKTEQGNSRSNDKGKYKRITREANTNELHGGGLRRSSADTLRKHGRAKGVTEVGFNWTTTVKGMIDYYETKEHPSKGM